MCANKREARWWRLTGALATTLLMARAVIGSEPQEPQSYFWAQHVDVLQLVIGVLFATFVWFARRTLERIERIVDKQSDLIVRMDARLTKLEAEHAIMTCRKGQGPANG